MEGFESVPMTNNVPVAVVPKISVAEGMGEFRENNEHVDSNVVEKADVQVEQPNKNQNAADKLFDFAKNDGVDVALEKFADDSFVENDDSMKIDEGELRKEEVRFDAKETATNPLEQKVAALENRVSDLLSKNGELTEKLEKSEKRLDIAMQTVKDLVEIIKRLVAEKEMSEEERASILEIVFILMSRLMQAMFVPEKSDGVMQGVSAERQTEKDKKIFEMFGRVEKKAA